MEINLLEKSKDGMKCTFILKGVDLTYANGLRRIFIENVPVLAIEDVEMRKNSSDVDTCINKYKAKMKYNIDMIDSLQNEKVKLKKELTATIR